MKKRILIMVLVSVFALTACGGGQTDEPTTVALVNGESITKAEFDQRFNIIAGQYKFDPDSPEHEQYRAELETQVLNSMIDEMVLLEEAEKRGISIDPEDIDKDIEMYKNSFSSEEEFTEYLNQQLEIDEAEFRELLKKDKIVAMMFDEVTGHITESPTSPQEYFEENREVFVGSDEAAATHILVETAEEAEEIIALLEEGADMNELASERSIDPSAQFNGGDLGFFNKGDMVQPFEEAVFSMEVGDVYPEPVQTQFGFHVIRLDDRSSAEDVTFEDVREEIEFYLVDYEKNLLFEEYINELREAAEIEIVGENQTS